MDSVHWLILCCAIVLDMLVGDPDWLWRKLPHPVVLFGRLIAMFDDYLNQPQRAPSKRRFLGTLTCLILLFIAISFGLILDYMLAAFGMVGIGAEIVIVSILIAQKSLSDHVQRVAKPLAHGDLQGARDAISMIVGRDRDQLDEAGMARASIESLAENFSDGVVAPVFWYALFGLPGIMAYKMLNTADSMIGHMSHKYRDFGWASARLDDLANWLPARASAFLIACAASVRLGPKQGLIAIQTAFRDAHFHRSPNAGWPEAAMAGALDIALAGPRKYKDHEVSDRFINEKGSQFPRASKLKKALQLFWLACCFELLLVTLFLAVQYLS